MEEKKLESPSKGRRSFLTKIWVALGLVALAEAIGVAFALLRPLKKRGPEENESALVAAGPVDGFERGSVTAFVRGRFYLVRLQDGGFLALSRKCTHLGCTIPWVEKEKRFACPCHGSAFDITGEAVEAPAPRPLDLFPLTIENENILVDTRKSIKRQTFQAGQIVYPLKKG
jgi:cytochrome b6-f complex iron-sulfur subunit